MNSTQSILIGDDQPGVLEALRLLLKSDGYRTVTADSPAGVLGAAAKQRFDLILVDLNYARDTTSGQEGLDLLNSLQRQQNQAPVVVMTAWGSIDLAVEAMRRGAVDFVQKPWDNDRVLATVRKQVEQHRRDRSELDIARDVQQKLLPHSNKTMRTIEYAGCCVPAREVGGDYYDFFDSGEDTLSFVLADVSGKGIPAALLMANLQATFRSRPLAELAHPATLLPIVNRLFFESTAPEFYATLFFGAYDDRTRVLRYVNCGHPPPVLVRSDGAVEHLDAASATVVGLFNKWECSEASLTLAPGDALFVSSDGVTEPALDDDEKRLLALLRGHQGQPLSQVMTRVLDDAAKLGSTDDLTTVALRATRLPDPA
jgi:sigma-B regulation protein RsbU (phosphoserine phosphatase)